MLSVVRHLKNEIVVSLGAGPSAASLRLSLICRETVEELHNWLNLEIIFFHFSHPQEWVVQVF